MSCPSTAVTANFNVTDMIKVEWISPVKSPNVTLRLAVFRSVCLHGNDPFPLVHTIIIDVNYC